MIVDFSINWLEILSELVQGLIWFIAGFGSAVFTYPFVRNGRIDGKR